MAEYETILVDTRGRVGWITLNRPEALNALNTQTMRDVVAAASAFDLDPQIGAIVLTGSERPLQALLGHRAAAADLLGLLDLYERGAGVADRKEQLGILVTAGSAVAPVHAVHSFFEREAMTPHVNGFTM